MTTPKAAPIPLTVVSGYLGAGKTTFINRLVRQVGSPRLCVIVNDFGELAIDAEILQDSDGLTLAVANGCVCCSAAQGLYNAFNTALTLDPLPEHIVIEASGVADPARLGAIAHAEPELSLFATYTLADCTAVRADLSDPLKTGCVVRQLQSANVIFLSKKECVDETEHATLQDLLSLSAPHVPIRDLPLRSELAGLLTGPPPGFDAPVPPPSAHDPGADYAVFSATRGALCDREGFLQRLETMAADIPRLKGLIVSEGRHEIELLNLAGGRISLETFGAAGPASVSRITAICARDGASETRLRSLIDRHFAHLPDT